MTQRRFDERPRRRRAGAGRPRKLARAGTGPVDDEIVGAAAHLFATHGIGATTMAQIADAVGLEVSSIYYYFSSKHEVLERIVVDVNRVPLAIAAEVQVDFTDAARRLHAFVRRDAAALCDFPFDFNEIHRLARDDRGNFERYWADRERLLVVVEAIVRQGIDEGVFVPVDPELAALTILANDEAVQNWYRPASGPTAARLTPSAIGAYVADIALRSLLVDVGQLAAVALDTAPAT
ncbi:MAG: TetR/AcrR family transcriptional regulator [Ilumatobacteraceae bacterium]